MTIEENNMTVFDIKALRKEVENEYLNKGYSGEDLESALLADSRYPHDRLIEVTGYDLKNNKVLGLLGEQKCEVTISQAAFNKGEEMVAKQKAAGKIQSPNAWSGHKIDENMAKSIPEKSQLILQESVMETNGEVVSLVASRIVKVAAASENTFAGLFSMSGKAVDNPQIAKVQHWKPRGTDFVQINGEVKNDSVTKHKMK